MADSLIGRSVLRKEDARLLAGAGRFTGDIGVVVEGQGDRRVVRTPFVFVGNNEYTLEGGRIDTRARLDAGVLQVCVAPGVDRLGMLRIFAAAIAGRVGTTDMFEATTVPALIIRGRTSRLGVSIDGEMMTMQSPLRYRIRRGALRVVVPA